MTKKLPRVVAPYTRNVANSTGTANKEFQENIVAVIKDYFPSQDLVERCLADVWDAATQYELSLGSNPDRAVTQKQRDDRDELLEALRETRIRLDPAHIPLPLLSRATAQYQPGSTGAPSLTMEIADMRRRISDLIKLFEATDLPTPTTTNPGKPERDSLIARLCEIFDCLAATDPAYTLSSPQDVRNERKEFVTRTCQLISPSISVPRRI